MKNRLDDHAARGGPFDDFIGCLRAAIPGNLQTLHRDLAEQRDRRNPRSARRNLAGEFRCQQLQDIQRAAAEFDGTFFRRWGGDKVAAEKVQTRFSHSFEAGVGRERRVRLSRRNLTPAGEGWGHFAFHAHCDFHSQRRTLRVMHPYIDCDAAYFQLYRKAT